MGQALQKQIVNGDDLFARPDGAFEPVGGKSFRERNWWMMDRADTGARAEFSDRFVDSWIPWLDKQPLCASPPAGSQCYASRIWCSSSSRKRMGIVASLGSASRIASCCASERLPPRQSVVPPPLDGCGRHGDALSSTSAIAGTLCPVARVVIRLCSGEGAGAAATCGLFPLQFGAGSGVIMSNFGVAIGDAAVSTGNIPVAVGRQSSATGGQRHRSWPGANANALSAYGNWHLGEGNC